MSNARLRLTGLGANEAELFAAQNVRSGESAEFLRAPLAAALLTPGAATLVNSFQPNED